MDTSLLYVDSLSVRVCFFKKKTSAAYYQGKSSLSMTAMIPTLPIEVTSVLFITLPRRRAGLGRQEVNGFNSISREAIFAGLRRWYPPGSSPWWRCGTRKVPRRLFLFNEEAREAATATGLHVPAEGE